MLTLLVQGPSLGRKKELLLDKQGQFLTLLQVISWKLLLLSGFPPKAKLYLQCVPGRDLQVRELRHELHKREKMRLGLESRSSGTQPQWAPTHSATSLEAFGCGSQVPGRSSHFFPLVIFVMFVRTCQNVGRHGQESLCSCVAKIADWGLRDRWVPFPDLPTPAM